MKQGKFTVKENREIAPSVFRTELYGDTSAITNPGQFINIKIDGLFLRRPISVCDLNGNTVTVIYKIAGKGTDILSKMKLNTELDILTGLGNGYDTSYSGNNPLLIGGGVGVPPLYLLCKKLLSENKQVKVILGFNKKSEKFYEDEFKNLGADVRVTTVDGTYGIKGFVTDALKDIDFSYYYCCGPEPMLKAVYKSIKTGGQLSFEKRMGCGFGACMGCSCKTISGNKRICKDGPVLFKEDIIWED